MASPQGTKSKQDDQSCIPKRENRRWGFEAPAKNPLINGKNRELVPETWITPSVTQDKNGTGLRQRTFDNGAALSNATSSVRGTGCKDYEWTIAMMRMSQQVRSEEPQMTEDDSSTDDSESLRARQRHQSVHPSIHDALEPKPVAVTIGPWKPDLEARIMGFWEAVLVLLFAIFLVCFILFLSVVLRKFLHSVVSKF